MRLTQLKSFPFLPNDSLLQNRSLALPGVVWRETSAAIPLCPE